jgi:hypothetical protein
MARLTLILAALAACGSDADPHAVGGCTGWTNNDGSPFTGMCEAACATKPADSGTSCDTRKMLGCGSSKFEELEGCCIADMGTIVFFECGQ